MEPARISGESARVVTPPEYLVNANERQYLAKLCWLLHDAGTHALRLTFDSVHPPLNLRHHLAQQHVRTVLRRLLEQKVLTDKQWNILYPTRSKEITSEPYDAQLLEILLQFICHLSPPYPHGWTTLPLPSDTSLSADVVRLQMYFQQAGSLGGVRHEEYPVLWKQIVEVLLRMGGPEVRVKIARIDQETLTPDQQAHFIALIKNAWCTQEEGTLGRLRKMDGKVGRSHRGNQRSSKRRTQNINGNTSELTGISPEDRAVLAKIHRQVCETVLLEDIVDRLVYGHVINFSERQEVMSPSKNADRMHLFMSKILNSKLPYAFKLLCDAIKFKYPILYESIMKTRKAVYKDGVKESHDGAAIFQEDLAIHYRSLFSKLTPLPWADTQATIRDVYVPLDIVTEEGKKLHLSQVFPPAVTSGRGQRVLLEGESGSGKTYLCAMLAYTWAGQKTSFQNRFNFLILIDARELQGQSSLAKSIQTQVLPENSKISAEELWALLEQNARDTIFIVDGFDEDHSNEELKQVILGDKLRSATIFVTSRPDVQARKWMYVDYQLYVLGLSGINVDRCFKSYAVLARMTSEEYDHFHEILISPELNFRLYFGNPFLCLIVFGIYLAMGSAGLASISSLTELFEQYLVAMATNFCHKSGIDISGTEFPDEVISAVRGLQMLAFKTLVTKGKLLVEVELEHITKCLRAAIGTGNDSEGHHNSVSDSRSVESENGESVNAETDNKEDDWSVISRLGVLSTVPAGSKWTFTSSMLRDFLAARHLSDMQQNLLDKTMNEYGLHNSSKFAQTVAFLCGLFRNDTDPTVAESVLKDMLIQTFKRTRKISPKGGNAEYPYRKEYSKNGVDNAITNFFHALYVLGECCSRQKVVEDLAKSLPKTMSVSREGLIPSMCLTGLARVIQDSNFCLTHFEIDLLPHQNFHNHALLSLADALAMNTHLQDVVVRWYSFPLVVDFSRACLQNAPPLQSIVFQDVSKTPAKNIPASTWAGLQELCTLLQNTKSFSFLDCRSALVVSQLVLYIPTTVLSIDLSGCDMNNISAADLGSRLQSSHHCASLNLSDTRLEGSDLTALLQDLKLCSSLKALILSGIRLDRVGGTALGEYTRLTSSLERLDLSRCQASTDVCRILSGALRQNKSLEKLVLTDASISTEGRQLLTSYKKEEKLTEGLVRRTYLT